MILPSLASPIALAFMLVQDDSAAPSLVGSPGAALLEMVRNSGSIAQGVLVVLLLASVFSWAIMLSKWRAFARARKQGAGFLKVFRKSGRLSEIATVCERFLP